jgi:hypothetical protein
LFYLKGAHISSHINDCEIQTSTHEQTLVGLHWIVISAVISCFLTAITTAFIVSKRKLIKKHLCKNSHQLLLRKNIECKLDNQEKNQNYYVVHSKLLEATNQNHLNIKKIDESDNDDDDDDGRKFPKQIEITVER